MTEEDSSSMNWYYDNDNGNGNGNGNELPPPEDLIPLSQSLITPDLALAFNISNNSNSHHNRHAPPPQPPPPPPHPNSSSAEFDSSAGGSDEPARTLKRPRLVWTPQLHKRFVDAVAHLGIKNAVPKTIMQLMSVDGLTRENVASHLQKYRLYLKRMQHGMSNSSGSAPDTATDRLFASSPVPPHFLNPDTRVGGSVGGGYLPFVPVPGAMHHHGMAVVAPGVGPGTMHPQLRQFENNHHLMRQQSQQNQLRMPIFVEDLEQPANGRRVLTLFPTADD